MHPDLRTLLHTEHKTAEHFSWQIKRFLDNQKKSGSGARQMRTCHLEDLFDCVLSVQPPDSVEQARDLIREVRQLKLWLDGGDLPPNPRDVESTGKKLLIKALSDEHKHIRWAECLIDTFSDGAWEASMDIKFCSTLNAPKYGLDREKWSGVIGKLIGHAIDRQLGDMKKTMEPNDHSDRLEGIILLWEADEQRWSPDEKQLKEMEWMSQHMGEDVFGQDRDKKAKAFVALLKKRALSKTAGLGLMEQDGADMEPSPSSKMMIQPKM